MQQPEIVLQFDVVITQRFRAAFRDVASVSPLVHKLLRFRPSIVAQLNCTYIGQQLLYSAAQNPLPDRDIDRQRGSGNEKHKRRNPQRVKPSFANRHL